MGVGGELGEVGDDGGDVSGCGVSLGILGRHLTQVELINDGLDLDQRVGIRDGQREVVEATLAFLFFGAVAIGAIRGEESANRGSGGVLGDERERAGREGGEDNAREPADDGGKAGCTDHVRRDRGRGGCRC